MNRIWPIAAQISTDSPPEFDHPISAAGRASVVARAAGMLHGGERSLPISSTIGFFVIVLAVRLLVSPLTDHTSSA
jgi:hypothetical protein